MYKRQLQSLGKPPKLTVKKSTPPLRTLSSSSSSVDAGFRMSKKYMEKEDEVSHTERYLNSTLQSNHQRLPKVDFTAMTLNQTKQKLSSLGLSTAGTKQNMIVRYSHFEILWNSNFCDSLDPVDEGELRRQLISWEASHNTQTANNNNTNSIIAKMKIKSTNRDSTYEKLLVDFKKDTFNRRAWIVLFKKDFKRLIKEAKEKLKSSTTTSNDKNTQPSLELIENKPVIVDELTDTDLSKEIEEHLQNKEMQAFKEPSTSSQNEDVYKRQGVKR